ncbi:MAG: hypothetical protein JST07_11265 [Bacteroidetes bacterium]|nr:hypothetical protein [Bacteroidota bacterium]
MQKTPSTGKDEKKSKKPKNKLLKTNMLYRRKNKVPLGGIGNHLACINKILRYPFESDHTFYCIDQSYFPLISEILKVFGYQSSYDSDNQLLKISFLFTPINYPEIRYHKYYGYVTPLPTMLELRNLNTKLEDEDIKKFHLDCIKKVLKCEPSKIIKYYIPNFGLLDDILKTLIEYQYTINFTKNILTINL